MIYIKVADLDASIAQVVKLSGGVLITIKKFGIAVIMP
jgi:predicted enzyme related to lactoylglutathione lyase